ncbi:MAG TPA: hypothetical protein PLW09_05150 [Candidatus Kapabacteria bacterium]|jgi:hypothetical protein|nr:hypothetical protein [Candidatus Kapabacteria bacterium]
MKGVIAYSITLCLLCVGGLMAQPYQRPCNPAALKFSRVWYPNYAMYQMQYPVLQNVPPLNTGMPLEVLYSYIYLDSLLRNVDYRDFQNRLKPWNTINDTLKFLAQGLTILKDYDPIRYNQYRIESHLRGFKQTHGMVVPIDSTLHAENTPVHYPETYKSDIFTIENQILGKFRDIKERTGGFTNDNRLIDVLSADYVYRATVIAVDSMKSKYYLKDTTRRIIYDYRVIVTIQDTLKGKVLKPITINNTLTNHDNHKYLAQEHQQYYQFQYSTHHCDETLSPLIQKPDGFIHLVPGQELIVFLSFSDFLLDCHNDYYDNLLDLSCKSYILPITNGTVHDIKKVWSSTGSIPYTDWKNEFMQIKNKLLTRNY